MNLILLILLISHVDGNRENIIVQHVDQIEIVHYYDERAGLIFDVLNLWDYNEDGHKEFVAFILIKNARKKMGSEELAEAIRQHQIEWLKKHPNSKLTDIPKYNAEWIGSNYSPEKSKHGYTSTFYHNNSIYKIHAPTFKEDWTQKDEEVINREYFPKDNRRNLAFSTVQTLHYLNSKIPFVEISIGLEFLLP